MHPMHVPNANRGPFAKNFPKPFDKLQTRFEVRGSGNVGKAGLLSRQRVESMVIENSTCRNCNLSVLDCWQVGDGGPGPAPIQAAEKAHDFCYIRCGLLESLATFATGFRYRDRRTTLAPQAMHAVMLVNKSYLRNAINAYNNGKPQRIQLRISGVGKRHGQDNDRELEEAKEAFLSCPFGMIRTRVKTVSSMGRDRR